MLLLGIIGDNNQDQNPGIGDGDDDGDDHTQQSTTAQSPKHFLS